MLPKQFADAEIRRRRILRGLKDRLTPGQVTAEKMGEALLALAPEWQVELDQDRVAESCRAMEEGCAEGARLCDENSGKTYQQLIQESMDAIAKEVRADSPDERHGALIALYERLYEVSTSRQPDAEMLRKWAEMSEEELSQSFSDLLRVQVDADAADLVRQAPEIEAEVEMWARADDDDQDWSEEELLFLNAACAYFAYAVSGVKNIDAMAPVIGKLSAVAVCGSQAIATAAEEPDEESRGQKIIKNIGWFLLFLTVAALAAAIVCGYNFVALKIFDLLYTANAGLLMEIFIPYLCTLWGPILGIAVYAAGCGVVKLWKYLRSLNASDPEILSMEELQFDMGEELQTSDEPAFRLPDVQRVKLPPLQA